MSSDAPIWIANTDAHPAEYPATSLYLMYLKAGKLYHPNGKQIAYVANRTAEPDITSGYDDIYIVPADGGAERRGETPQGHTGSLAWSPDGRRIAYVKKSDGRESLVVGGQEQAAMDRAGKSE